MDQEHIFIMLFCQPALKLASTQMWVATKPTQPGVQGMASLWAHSSGTTLDTVPYATSPPENTRFVIAHS